MKNDGRGAESLTPYFAQQTIRYMLQICVMTGPSAPKGDGHFFLTPLLDEIQDLCCRVTVVECHDGKEGHSKVLLLIATGGFPVVANLASHPGHTS